MRPDFRLHAELDLLEAGPFIGTRARRLDPPEGRFWFSAPISSIGVAIRGDTSAQTTSAASASGWGEPGVFIDAASSAKRAKRAAADKEGPEWFKPATCPGPLEIEGGRGFSGSFIVTSFS